MSTARREWITCDGAQCDALFPQDDSALEEEGEDAIREVAKRDVGWTCFATREAGPLGADILVNHDFCEACTDERSSQGQEAAS